MFRTLLLAAVCCIGFAQSAGATPIKYHATYTIESLIGIVPPAWGSITQGDTVQATFLWDASVAVPADETNSAYLPGPLLDYSLRVGDATIFPVAMDVQGFAVRENLSASLGLLDRVPGSTPGSFAIDDVVFRFECADWTDLTGLPASLDCPTGFAGNFLIFPVGHDEIGLRVTGPLSSIEKVPEPDSLALLVLGVAGTAAVRRSRRDSF